MKKFLTITCTILACASLAIGAAACDIGLNSSSSSLGTGDINEVEKLKTMNPVYDKYAGTPAIHLQTLSVLDGYTFDTTADATNVFGNYVKLGKQGGGLIYDMQADTTFKNYTVAEGETYTFETVKASSSRAIELANSVLVETVTKADTVTKSFYDVSGAKFAQVKGADYQDAVAKYLYDVGMFSVEITTQDATNAEAEPVTEAYYFNKELKQVEYTYTPVTPDPLDGVFESDKAAIRESYDKVSYVGVPDAFGMYAGYLCYNYDEEQKYVSYDGDMNVLYTLDLPSTANVGSILVFDNGNYILQYVENLALNAEKYDFLMQGDKYNLTTLLVDVKTQTTNELKCNFILPSSVITPAYIQAYKPNMNVSDGIEVYFQGIGEVTNDKTLDYNYQNTWFGITSEGVIKRAASLVEGLDVVKAEELADGSFKVVDATDKTYIVSAEGKILKEVNEERLNTLVVGKCDSYLQVEKNIYNNKLDKVYTLEDGFEIETWLTNALVIKETVTVAPENSGDEPTYTYKWHLLKDDEDTVIADSAKGETATYLSGMGYVIKKEVSSSAESTYAYYNENGEKAEISEAINVDFDSMPVFESVDMSYGYYLCSIKDSAGVSYTTIIKYTRK